MEPRTRELLRFSPQCPRSALRQFVAGLDQPNAYNERCMSTFAASHSALLLSMRVLVTDRQHVSEQQLVSTSELAPTLVMPWLRKLRYCILAFECVLILFASSVAHIALLLDWLAFPLSIGVVSNLSLPRFCARIGPRRALGLTLVLDIILLTTVLAIAGGPANPFSLLYLVQITFSAVVLSRMWTWLLGLLSILGFGFLFFFHVPVTALEGHHPSQTFSAHLIGMWVAFVTAAVLVSVLISRITQTLRGHEQELLRLQNLLERQERVASLATLAAQAAHEMGTPLATIAIVAKELERYARSVEGNPHVAADAKLIRAEVDRCARILRDMSSQGAEPIGETPSPIDIDALFQQLRNSFPEPQRQVIETFAVTGLTARLPAETTRKVLMALVKNALDASTAGQPVCLRGDADEGTLCFTVCDQGIGMSPEVMNRIAEPFFSTKGPDRGMGLGTFLVRAFAENLGGKLTFESQVGRGTTATLELPFVI